MRIGKIGAWMAAAALISAGCGGGGSRPNVVVVTIESLRADHLGCYGYDLPTSPHLDRFAAESIRFDRAYSVTSWTLPSHAALLTGMYPSAVQVTEPHHKLSDSYATLAETLAEEGYHTAAFVSGPFLRTPYNLNQGFALYDDGPSAVTQETAHGDVTNPSMERAVTAFLRSRPEEPFFLFAYFWDVHYDFIPPPPYDTMFVTADMEPFDGTGFESNNEIRPDMSPERFRYLVSQYDGEIRSTDEMFGRLFGVLREEGLWENTAILVTADHGEEFFEHGAKGHKHNLHVETLHVPLLFKPPGLFEPAVDGRVASLIDVAPTVLGLCGVRPPEGVAGRSLLAPAEDAPRELFYELYLTYYGYVIGGGFAGTKTFDSFALRKGGRKYIRLPMKGGERLYDVLGDPAERQDLSDSLAAELPDFRAKVEEYIARAEAIAASHGAAPDAALSAEERERLEALGYIQTVPRAP
ncbi:MAG: sulfatase [Candidatus Eisenbacteria bacterium]